MGENNSETPAGCDQSVLNTIKLVNNSTELFQRGRCLRQNDECIADPQVVIMLLVYYKYKILYIYKKGIIIKREKLMCHQHLLKTWNKQKQIQMQKMCNNKRIKN